MTGLVARSIGIRGRLEPCDLDVQPGGLVALIGPNGGGKTSLLRALARIEGASGVVSINGEDVDLAPAARRRQLLAYLPASRDVIWPISVRDVIALGLDRPDEARIDELITLLELERLAQRAINQLSTGERARVLMARAMAAKPRVLLLDEPLSNLDPYWVLRFVDLFHDAASSGQTVLVALHDLAQLDRFEFALLVADGGIQMNEAPASLTASERFKNVFRIDRADGRWAIRRSVDRQSSL